MNPSAPGVRPGSARMAGRDLPASAELEVAEANSTGFVAAELDVCDLVGWHQDPAALIVSEGKHAAVLDCRLQRLLDLVALLVGLQDELARCGLYADLDFHRLSFRH